MTFRRRPSKHRNLPFSGGHAALLIAFCFWVSVLFAPLRITNRDTMRDFEVFWTAASRAAQAAPLYRIDDGHFQFKYLPAFAVVSSPASLLPLDIAKGKWLTVSVALMLALVGLSVWMIPQRRRRTWVLVAVTFVTMAKFFGHELTLGQVNLLFAVLCVCGIIALSQARGATAAALFVAAVVVKPYAVLFLPWVAVLGGARAAVSAAIGMVAVIVAPIGLYGARGSIDLHRAWWETVTTSTTPNLTNPDNVSLAAFAAKWVGVSGTASLLATGLSLALLAVAAAIIWRGRGIERRAVLEGAVLLTLVPLISPQGWDYVFLVAAPAIALLANYDRELPSWLGALTWITLGVIGLSLYDLLGRARYRMFMDWSVITVCFLVVILGLATLRLRRVA